MGNLQSLTIDLLVVPVAVRTVTIRTKPSLPAWVSITRPVFHFKGGRFRLAIVRGRRS